MKKINDDPNVMVVTSYGEMPEGYAPVAFALERAWEELRDEGRIPLGDTHVELRAVEHEGSDEPFILLALPERGLLIGILAVTKEAEQFLQASGLPPEEWVQREAFYDVMSLFMRRSPYTATGWEPYHPTLGLSGAEYKRAVEGALYAN